MSSAVNRNISSFRAGGAISKGQPVKLSSGAVIACTASTDRMIGLAQNDAVSGGGVEVAMPGGGGFGKAGAGISAGDLLGVNGSGLLVKVAAQHDLIVAQAHEDAVLNDVFGVMVIGPSMATQAQS